MKKVENLFKRLSIILMTIIALLAIVVIFILNSNSKDLVEKGLVENVSIQNKNLVFQVKEKYAGSLNIGYNSQTIYSQDLGKKISNLTIENYPAILDDKKIYHFMLYNYELGGHHFSGFDFCINNQKVFYGNHLKSCLR